MQKETDYITRKMTQNIFRSFDYAKASNVAFNKFIVLHLHETDAQSACTIFQKIRHKYRDWLSYHCRATGRRIAPMYTYSFEAPGKPHINWVLNVPPELLEEFLDKLPKWIVRVQGPLGPYDLRVKDINPHAYKQMANYIVKGCDPAFVDHFYLGELYAKHGPQGAFWGRRAGVSPALNRGARDLAGYDPRRRRIITPVSLAA